MSVSLLIIHSVAHTCFITFLFLTFHNFFNVILKTPKENGLRGRNQKTKGAS